MSECVLLCAARAALGETSPGPAAGRALGRADRIPDGLPGLKPQLQRHVRLLPSRWPMAAITRQLDAGDAGLGQWLRADPAYVQADINAGRMLACGNLGLNFAETEALLKPLQPLFGDAGFPISAPVPERWYLQLPLGARLPAFADPEQALGDDLYDHLPQGTEGRQWRALLNEAQILLHNHPINAERRARGLLPANSVWFWGAGLLPDHVQMTAQQVLSDASDLAGLARLAGVDLGPARRGWAGEQSRSGSLLIDLRGLRDASVLEADWLLPALVCLAEGRFERLRLDFADGIGLVLTSRQHWRFWRRALGHWQHG